MKKIQNGAALIFIFCIVILTIITIFGVWDMIDEDVISKSIQTIGLLGVVTMLVIFSGKFFEHEEEGMAVPMMPNPIFPSIRKLTVVTMIVSCAFLAFLGVLSIWEVISGQILQKSLTSLAVIAFASLFILITCAQREKGKIFQMRVSGWMIFLMVLLSWMFLRAFFRY